VGCAEGQIRNLTLVGAAKLVSKTPEEAEVYEIVDISDTLKTLGALVVVVLVVPWLLVGLFHYISFVFRFLGLGA
jgi:hypothetical protein